MKAAAFRELLKSVRDAGAYLKGNRKAVARTDRISPHSVAAIRAKLKLSQAQFARAFGISLDILQNWEQGRRQPTGPAKVLLRVRRTPPKGRIQGGVLGFYGYLPATVIARAAYRMRSMQETDADSVQEFTERGDRASYPKRFSPADKQQALGLHRHAGELRSLRSANRSTVADRYAQNRRPPFCR